MKLFPLLVLLEVLSFGYGEDIAKDVKSRLISYETKIFHKIPDHTIQEGKKLGVLKTRIVLEKKAEEQVEEKVVAAEEEKVEEKVAVEEEKVEAVAAEEVGIEEKVAEEEVKKPSLLSYEFGYGVKDPLSGDHKDQWEKRRGDYVKGSYRFDESDGTQRVVEYEASGKRGFEATVKNFDRKEAIGSLGAVEEKSGALKEIKVAHSYSYLKRNGQ